MKFTTQSLTSFTSSFFPEASIMKISKLCKFCDIQPTNCSGKGNCKVECGITSICPQKEDVCVSIW